MIKTDCHVHSLFSSDSSTPVEEMIEKAISLGFDTFYLTDHMDYDYPVSEDGLDFLFDAEKYFETLNALKEKYQKQIELRIGIELGLKAEQATQQKIEQLVSSYPFDLIIGSTHLVHNVDPYDSVFWKDRSEETCLRDFFKATYENIKANPYVSVLGHLDYAIRYSPSKGADFSYEQYKDCIDPILEFIIEHNIALEVNTCGYRYVGAPNPSADIIRKYLTLGGKMISIGSDAHAPKFYASQFKQAEELLSSLGCTHYTIFKQGEPQLIRFL